MKRIILFCTLIVIFAKYPVFSQPMEGQELLDSLLTELPKAKEDTSKVIQLNSIGRTYLNMSEFEKALSYCNKALTIAEKVNFKNGIANAHHIIGIIVTQQGNYNDALKHYDTALKIREELNDQKGMAAAYNNIGLVNQNLGRYPIALKMYLSALKINETMDNRAWVAGNYNNIGIIYMIQEKYEDALKNIKAALKIHEETGNRFDMNHPYNNIGNIYFALNNFDEALKNYEESYKIRLEMGDKFEIANILSNIGVVYQQQGKYSEAINKLDESFKLSSEIGDQAGIASYYNNIGDVNRLMKKFSLARTNYEKGLELTKEIGNLEGLKFLYGAMAELDSATGNFESAFLNYKMHIIYKDSLINEENSKQLVQQQMQYDFDKKEASTKAEQDKKDLMVIEEAKRQRNIRNSSFAGIAALMLFSVVVIRQRNKVSKSKKRSDELLLNILPSETAEELKATGTTKAKDFDEVTVLFTDFKNFTTVSETLSAQELVNEINYCYSAFDNIVGKYGIEKIKTIGDSYMCAGGLPVANKTNAEDAVKAAMDIHEFMIAEKQKRELEGRTFFDIRIGLHTGPVVAGIVGIKKFAYDIWGDTVNIASRMESSGEAGKVNISGSTYELVKNKFHCTYRGKIHAKNKGEIDMYFVERSLNT